MLLVFHFLLISLTIFQVNCSVASDHDDCKVLVCKLLASVCREDPNCPNARVFYLSCLQKHADQNQDCLFLPKEEEVADTNSNLLSDSSTYETSVTQKQYTPSYYLLPLTDEDSQQKNVETDSSNAENRNLKKEELLRIYNLYKRHSLKESLDSIREKVDGLLASKYSQTNTKDKPYQDKNSEVGIIALRRAIKLLKDSIKERSQSDSKLNKKAEKEIFPSKRGTKLSAQEKQSVQGREEIAIPVYSSEEEETKEEKPTSNLIIELSQRLESKKAVDLADLLQKKFGKSDSAFSLQNIDDHKASYEIVSRELSAEAVASQINRDSTFSGDVENQIGARIVRASVKQPKTAETGNPVIVEETEQSVLKGHITIFAAVVGACTVALIIAAVAVFFIKRQSKEENPFAFKKQEAVQDYQELCRTQMSVANAHSDDEDEEDNEKNNTMRHNWYDEQFPYNMDISTGHVILAYMEDHLRNENRLNKEWEALCSYKADDPETTVGSDAKNITRNRYRDVLPYDRTRVKLREVLNVFHCDYINANFITDVDPNNPDYIATQGPLDNTVADFWQMVWEQGVVVIVNLTKLSDMGLPQCHRYWPENGSEIFHIYEVHLISEHIWCDDYLVRSLYLKNLQTGETRTITQFHYLTWPDLSIPDSAKPLLEFRRKVNKCYRGQQCPIIVHCNNGVGRTGTYILLDMVLNKMIKGAKEIDIAATLEHLRDQRPDMVKTKGQFEFSLTAMAEEVTAILSAAPK